MNELRRNPLSRQWTCYLTNVDFMNEILKELKRGVNNASDYSEDNVKNCVFCPGKEAETPPTIMIYKNGVFFYRLKEGSKMPSGWEVRVIPQQHPVFQVEGELSRRGSRLYDIMAAKGANELIINHPDHNKHLPAMNELEMAKVLKTVKERFIDLSKDREMGHPIFFINHGLSAGAVYSHTHSEIIISPFVPENTRKELQGAKDWFKMKERCLFCDIIDDEIIKMEKKRTHQIITMNKDFMAFVPFFSAYPFEIWIIPGKHESDYKNITENQIISASQILNICITLIRRVLGDVPFNLILLTQPNKVWGIDRGYWLRIEDDWHWRFAILPHLPDPIDKLKGMFYGTGSRVNPVLPEHAAQILRDQLAISET